MFKKEKQLNIAIRISFFIKDIKRIWSLIWIADKRLAVISIVLQLIQAVLPVFSLYYIKELIEALTSKESNSPDSFYIPLIIFGVIQFFLAIIGQYLAYVNTIFGQKLTDYLSGIVLRKATDIDYEYYEQPSYHDTLHLAQQQSMQRAPALLAIFNSVLLNSTSLLSLIIFFFTLKSLFALWFILLSLPLAFIKWRFGHSIVQQERRLVPWVRESNYIHNSLTGASFAKEVRVLGFGNQFIEKFRSIRSYIFDEKRKLNVKLANFSLLAETLEIIVMIALFVMLARSAFYGAITIGTFVIYIQGFQRMQTTSRNFLQSVVQVLQQKDFLKDLFAFLDIEPSSSKGKQLDFPIIKTGLSVRDISFTYPSTDRVVLQDINIDCKPGNIIAIVGENGSGKSTLVKLLSRLYHVQSGSIQIDNVAVSDIAEKQFRQNSIFLFQDYEKHFLTVKENIALGTEYEIDNERVNAAAILSDSTSFIGKLKNGKDTRLGRMFDKSIQLSGGEWQKLSIARIFYKKPELIVLDEPTSALDALAEALVFRNIKNELNDKMVVLISHRLYNLKLVDHIYVMEAGRITEHGPFDELIKANGHFRKMYEAQKL